MKSFTIESDIHFERRGRGSRRVLESGTDPTADAPVGRLPRITRLMALAIRFDDLIQNGEVTDYAELARLGHVSRARVTQIMNLLMLAPDIQEQILHLPRVMAGRDPIHLRQRVPKPDPPVVQEVHGTGFGCIMLRSELVREFLFQIPPGERWYDPVFFKLMDGNWKRLLDWRLEAKHVGMRFIEVEN
jgi:hypothetical protein